MEEVREEPSDTSAHTIGDDQAGSMPYGYTGVSYIYNGDIYEAYNSLGASGVLTDDIGVEFDQTEISKSATDMLRLRKNADPNAKQTDQRNTLHSSEEEEHFKVKEVREEPSDTSAHTVGDDQAGSVPYRYEDIYEAYNSLRQNGVLTDDIKVELANQEFLRQAEISKSATDMPRLRKNADQNANQTGCDECSKENCSQLGLMSFAHGSEFICAVSGFTGIDITFTRAESFCRSIYMRLCTVSELRSYEDLGAAGGWSSTECITDMGSHGHYALGNGTYGYYGEGCHLTLWYPKVCCADVDIEVDRCCDVDFCAFGAELSIYDTSFTSANWNIACTGCTYLFRSTYRATVDAQKRCTNSVFNDDCTVFTCIFTPYLDISFNMDNPKAFVDPTLTEDNETITCIKELLMPCIAAGSTPPLEVALQLMTADGTNETINSVIPFTQPIGQFYLYGVIFYGPVFFLGNAMTAHWFDEEYFIEANFNIHGVIIILFYAGSIQHSSTCFMLGKPFWFFLALDNKQIRSIDFEDVFYQDYYNFTQIMSPAAQFFKVTSRYGTFYHITATQRLREDCIGGCPTVGRIFITEAHSSNERIENTYVTGAMTRDFDFPISTHHINTLQATKTLYYLLFAAPPLVLYTNQQVDELSETLLSTIVRQECKNWRFVWLRNRKSDSAWSTAVYRVMLGEGETVIPPAGLGVTEIILDDVRNTLTHDYANELCKDPCTREGITPLNCFCYASATAKCGNSVVTGTVFYDLNQDGVQELPLEFGIKDITLEVFDDSNADGTIQSYKRMVCNTTTDAAGEYLCDGFVEGYYVTNVTDVNRITSDSCQEITTGSSVVSYFVSASEDCVIHFGFFPAPGGISGRIWYDEERTGSIVENRGFKNIATTLYRDIDGNGVLTGADQDIAEFTTTEISGYYQYPTLAPASYIFAIHTSSREIGELELIQTDGPKLPFSFLILEGEQFSSQHFAFGPRLNPGSCKNICGSFDPDSIPKCFCSLDCISRGDCCLDLADNCAREIKAFLDKQTNNGPVEDVTRATVLMTLVSAILVR